MAKPKLALIPAAQGSKLFSVLPSSGVGDFDFSRSGSATRINSQGLIEEVANGVSRLNYPMIDGKVVGCPHHILEPQRTNLVTYSESFENYFNVSEVTLNSNNAISPDGTLDANKVTFPSASKSMYNNGLSFSGTHTVSFWYKGEGSNIGKTFNVRLALGASAQNFNVTLESGWKRFEAQNNGLQVIEITNRNNTTIGTGSLLLYGFQVEAGSYPTSYIKTNGSAVTRAAETANGSGDASTFNDSEGVLMAEISALADDETDRFVGINDGSNSNRIVIGYTSVSSNTPRVIVTSGGATQAAIDFSISDITETIKILAKYKLNDVDLWINGYKVGSDTSATMPIGLNNCSFDSDGVGGTDFYGNTKQVQYYDSVLTDSELEQLTSWTSFTDMAEGQLYTIE